MIHTSNIKAYSNSQTQDYISIFPFLIVDEASYDKALSIAEFLFFKSDRSPIEDQALDVWTVLIDKYEKESFSPGSDSTPLSILESLMEARGFIQADLVKAGLGSSGIVSEILNGKRGISKKQAKLLGELFRVSPSLFILGVS